MNWMLGTLMISFLQTNFGDSAVGHEHEQLAKQQHAQQREPHVRVLHVALA